MAVGDFFRMLLDFAPAWWEIWKRVKLDPTPKFERPLTSFRDRFRPSLLIEQAIFSFVWAPKLIPKAEMLAVAPGEDPSEFGFLPGIERDETISEYFARRLYPADYPNDIPRSLSINVQRFHLEYIPEKFWWIVGEEPGIQDPGPSNGGGDMAVIFPADSVRNRPAWPQAIAWWASLANQTVSFYGGIDEAAAMGIWETWVGNGMPAAGQLITGDSGGGGPLSGVGGGGGGGNGGGGGGNNGSGGDGVTIVTGLDALFAMHGGVGRTWRAGVTQMAKSRDNKLMAAQKKDGTWTVWRPRKPVVLMPGSKISKAQRKKIVRALKGEQKEATQFLRAMGKAVVDPERVKKSRS